MIPSLPAAVESRAETREGTAARVLLIIAAGTVLRLLAGAAIGLSVDEAYEVSVARPLSASYFDHPPLSFWIPGAVTALAGSEHAVLLRLPFILMFALSTWLMYRLGARLFSPRAGLFAALLLNLAPVFALTTGGWVLPDGPLTLFLLASALALLHALDPAGLHATRWWLLAGILSGLAMMSKYHGVFAVAGAFFFLVTRRDERRWLARWQPFAAAVVAFAVTSPVAVWNLRHDWISFRFQGVRGVPTTHGSHLAAFAETVGGQALYVLPWIWIPMIVLFARALRRGPRDRAGWFLISFAAGPILVFTAASLGGHPGLPHWEAPGYLFLFPLLGDTVSRAFYAGSRAWRAWLIASAAAFAILTGIALSDAATGWLSRAAPALVRKGDPTWEVMDWKELRDVVPRALAQDAAAAAGAGGSSGGSAGRAPFVAALRWMDAGKAACALGPGVTMVCLGDRPHQFQFVHPARDFLGADAIIVGHPEPAAPGDASPDVPPAPPDLAAAFARVEPLTSVVIHRAGRAEFTLPLYVGKTLLRAPGGESSR